MHLLEKNTIYYHLGMLIMYTTQCWSATREVITTALCCKYWSYSLGERKRKHSAIYFKVPDGLEEYALIWSHRLSKVYFYVFCLLIAYLYTL